VTTASLRAMVDFGRAVAVLLALVYSIRARSRAGVVASLLIAYCDGLESRQRARRQHQGGAWVRVRVVLIGPSSLPRSLVAGWPLADLVRRHPLGMQLITAACAAVPWRMLERQSSGLPPDSEAACRVDRARVQLVLVITFDLILGASPLYLALLARDQLEHPAKKRRLACRSGTRSPVARVGGRAFLPRKETRQCVSW
jgi:hypothetical protein